MLEIVTSEFPSKPPSYFRQAFADGRLRLETTSTSIRRKDGRTNVPNNLSIDVLQQPPPQKSNIILNIDIDTTPLKTGTRIRHLVHRHEPPVPASPPVTLLATLPHLIAVAKPPGMPVHVAGQYRKNTVLGILGAMHPELLPLLPVHRLDKPVSGVLVFARSREMAREFGTRIQNHQLNKVYIARVKGVFPENISGDGKQDGNREEEEEPASGSGGEWDGFIRCEAPLTYDRRECVAYVAPLGPTVNKDNGTHSDSNKRPGSEGGHAVAIDDDGAPVLVDDNNNNNNNKEGHDDNEDGQKQQQQQQQRRETKRSKRNPIPKKIRKALVANAAAKKNDNTQHGSPAYGKPALTFFRRLSVSADGRTTLVECHPRTGRTHQIRAHLAHLGHPIANDALYGGTFPGPLSCRGMAVSLGVAWGKGEGKEGERGGEGGPLSTSEELAAQSQKQQQQQQVEVRDEVIDAEAFKLSESLRQGDMYMAPEESRFVDSGNGADGECSHCPYFTPENYPLDVRPLWLHAWRYGSVRDGWSFEAPKPDWAVETITKLIIDNNEGS
jgi:23S rRNA-/tRNA-specific pseudouridylate synthase